jgi:hypothetical protein
MIETRIDVLLKRVGLGITSWLDEQELRKYICELQQQLADAKDKTRRDAA